MNILSIVAVAIAIACACSLCNFCGNYNTIKITFLTLFACDLLAREVFPPPRLFLSWQALCFILLYGAKNYVAFKRTCRHDGYMALKLPTHNAHNVVSVWDVQMF